MVMEFPGEVFSVELNKRVASLKHSRLSGVCMCECVMASCVVYVMKLFC